MKRALLLSLTFGMEIIGTAAFADEPRLVVESGGHQAQRL